MFGVPQILVSGVARRLAPAGCAVALLAACGQKGPLFLPQGEAATGRPTLTQILAPSTSVSTPAATPASAVPPTGTATPVRTP